MNNGEIRNERPLAECGGGENQCVTQKPLEEFSDKEIIAELKARGYSGRLEYTKTLKV